MTRNCQFQGMDTITLTKGSKECTIHKMNQVNTIITTHPPGGIKEPPLTEQLLGDKVNQLERLLKFRPGFQDVWQRAVGPLPASRADLDFLVRQLAIYENSQRMVGRVPDLPEPPNAMAKGGEISDYQEEQFAVILSLIRAVSPRKEE